MDKDAIDTLLKKTLSADRILWLKHGNLEGDDTDGHIDMIARFCAEHTIAYVKCYDEEDIHYEELNMMEQELKSLRQPDEKPYRLLPLPLPQPIYHQDGRRLPATYVNFLIINEAVLVPQYNCTEDGKAMDIFRKIFPDRDIVGIDALPLIKQGGSIHCATMHLPEGVL